MKYIVSIAVREADKTRYLPLRECESYEDAEIARNAYKRRNKNLPVVLVGSFRDEPLITNFAQITRSPEALAAFLADLPTLSGPWDDSFHRAFCDACPAENCDAENCPHNAERDNPLWWLGLAAEARA